jgi:hypothetical protein
MSQGHFDVNTYIYQLRACPKTSNEVTVRRRLFIFEPGEQNNFVLFYICLLAALSKSTSMSATNFCSSADEPGVTEVSAVDTMLAFVSGDRFFGCRYTTLDGSSSSPRFFITAAWYPEINNGFL